MGRGFNRSGMLVLVTATAFCHFAGCGGRAVVPSDSASVSGGAGVSNAGTGGSTGALIVGGFNGGAAALSNVGV